MYLRWDRVIIAIIIGALAVASVYSLDALGNPITREEAIGVSKNSELVKQALLAARDFSVETNYYNTSRLEELRKWHSDEIFKNTPKDAFWEEKVPEGHTAWEVIWWFAGIGAPSEGYAVIVIVDAEMGTIIHEEKGIHLL